MGSRRFPYLCLQSMLGHPLLSVQLCHHHCLWDRTYPITRTISEESRMLAESYSPVGRTIVGSSLIRPSQINSNFGMCLLFLRKLCGINCCRNAFVNSQTSLLVDGDWACLAILERSQTSKHMVWHQTHGTDQGKTADLLPWIISLAGTFVYNSFLLQLVASVWSTLMK